MVQATMEVNTIRFNPALNASEAGQMATRLGFVPQHGTNHSGSQLLTVHTKMTRVSHISGSNEFVLVGIADAQFQKETLTDQWARLQAQRNPGRLQVFGEEG